MKIKSDFANYTQEDFGKLLAKLLSKKNLFFVYCCFDYEEEHYRVYYDSLDNTLYQLTPNEFSSFIIGDVLYKNKVSTLSVYTLAYVNKFIKVDYQKKIEDMFYEDLKKSKIAERYKKFLSPPYDYARELEDEEQYRRNNIPVEWRRFEDLLEKVALKETSKRTETNLPF